MKVTHITKELLIKHDACKDGIDFFERNKLEGFPLSRLDEIKGDFEGYIGWVEDTNFSNHVEPKIFIKDPLCTYDENNNVLSYEDKKGFCYKYTYDDNGNELSYENSEGVWSKYTYDKNGNELSYEDDKGCCWKSTYDSRGNKLSYEDSIGEKTRYTNTYYSNGQLKSIHEDGVIILHIPKI